MERAFVGGALGFALSMLLAVASVELVAVDQPLAGSVMDTAMVVALGVAGLLATALVVDVHAASRRRRSGHEAVLVGHPIGRAAGEPPWLATPFAVEIDAPAATAWLEAEVELPGAARHPGQRRRGPRSRVAGLVRHAEPLSQRQWYEAVEAADLDGVFLDPRAHDDLPAPDEPGDWSAPLVGRGRAHSGGA